MSKYYVGLMATPSESAFEKFLFQANNLTMETDEYEAKDENGNTAVVQLINHRVRASLEAIVGKKMAIPVPGTIVKLNHLKLPTVAADGTVTGTFEVDPTSATEIEFLVTGSPSNNQSNTDFPHCSFEVVRYLANGVPDSDASDSQ